MTRTLNVLGLVVIVLGCGGSDSAAPPPAVGAPEVRVITALPVYNTAADRDDITIRLRNDGGPGAFYVEFWGYAGSPGGPPRIRQEDPVNVLADYDETVTYAVTGMGEVQAVKVKTRPPNTTVYTQTDCRQVRQGATFCP